MRLPTAAAAANLDLPDMLLLREPVPARCPDAAL
jgi:hypothetical protein